MALQTCNPTARSYYDPGSGTNKTIICDEDGNEYLRVATLPIDPSESATGSVMLVDELGVPYGVKHINNKPRVSSMSYLYDIAEGNVANHESWVKLGFTPTMTTVESDIWSKAGTVNFPAAAMQMSIQSSDNTNDKAAGTGALTITIQYLNNLYVEATETVTLNGTTWVDTVATNILRVNSIYVATAGTSGKAAGNITLADKATRAITYAYITAGYTHSRSSNFTVPLGKVLYVTSLTMAYGYSTNQTHYARIYTRATQHDGVKITGIFYPFTEIVVANSSQYVELSLPTKIIATVDIKVSGISTFSGIASVAMRGWMENA